MSQKLNDQIQRIHFLENTLAISNARGNELDTKLKALIDEIQQ